MPNTSLKNFIDNLKKLTSYAENEVKQEFRDGLLGAIAEDMNVEQLNDGQRADGTYLPDYSEVSVKVYGKPQGRIKLKETGEFHEKIKAEIRGDKLYLTDYSQKFLHKPARLAARYGYEIIGLTEKNIKKLTDDEVLPFVLRKIKKLLKIT